MAAAQVVTAAGLASAAYLFMDPGRWSLIIPELMLALSIMSAAVLFRLGRGFPQLPMRELSRDDIRSLTEAYNEVARRLALILALAALTMTSLALVSFSGGDSPWSFRPLLVSSSVFLGTLALGRAVALVKGDLSLARLQGEMAEREVARRRAREEEKRVSDAERSQPYQRPADYGGLASH